jgi:cellulose 1,4-beta-cellobiosidase
MLCGSLAALALLLCAACPNNNQPTSAPSVPKNLAVEGCTATTITLNWSAASNAESYQLFRDTSSTGGFAAKVFDAAGTSYTDTGLTTGSIYYYKVQATNSAGSSALSSAVSGTPLAVPATPTGLAVAVVSSTSLSLAWNVSASAATYQVFRHELDGFVRH